MKRKKEGKEQKEKEERAKERQREREREREREKGEKRGGALLVQGGRENRGGRGRPGFRPLAP